MGGRPGWTTAALAVVLALGGAWLLLDDGALEPGPSPGLRPVRLHAVFAGSDTSRPLVIELEPEP